MNANVKLASINMPLLERLRKGAACVAFLDGAPEPAADVADMLLKAASEIERLRMMLSHVEKAAVPFAQHDWMDAEQEDDNCKLTKHSGPITVGHWRALRAALASTANP